MTRPSLARRLPLAMAGVAAVAVLIAALVSWPLLTSAADVTARQSLARTADLTAEVLQRAYAQGPPSRGPGGVSLNRLEALLSAQRVNAYVVESASAGEVRPPLGADDVAAVTSGQSVSDTRDTGSGAAYVEGRPLGDDLGVLLVQPAAVANDLSAPVLRRFVVALLLGLAVAAAVGYWLARRITRPLGQAADAANAMGVGRRDVVVTPEGPQEVADIAIALNRLSTALGESEGRQREFFLTVSHELRTPLTSIKGYSEALADEIVDADDVPRVAAVMRTEADHLDRLVADLLDLARLGAVDVAVEPVEVDLAEVAADAVSAWAGRAERTGVRFVDEVVRTPTPVRTDPVRVRQIVDNLMENALRVTSEGAPVVLRIGPLGPSGWFEVEVRDGGPGLTAEDLAVAFEPGELYTRYRGIRKVGSGVGLALVARLAQRLGGRAEAGAAPEGGAAFRAVLPVVGPTRGA